MEQHLDAFTVCLGVGAVTAIGAYVIWLITKCDNTMTEFDKLVNSVRSWWNERIANGTQFEELSHYVKGLDYWGEGPWYDCATYSALHQEYALSRNLHDHVPGADDFKSAFTRATGLKASGKNVSIFSRSGVYVPRTLTVCRFGKRPLTPLPE